MPSKTRRAAQFAVVFLGCVALFTFTALDSELRLLARLYRIEDLLRPLAVPVGDPCA